MHLKIEKNCTIDVLAEKKGNLKSKLNKVRFLQRSSFVQQRYCRLGSRFYGPGIIGCLHALFLSITFRYHTVSLRLPPNEAYKNEPPIEVLI